jgi:hypothetical protein
VAGSYAVVVLDGFRDERMDEERQLLFCRRHDLINCGTWFFLGDVVARKAICGEVGGLLPGLRCCEVGVDWISFRSNSTRPR